MAYRKKRIMGLVIKSENRARHLVENATTTRMLIEKRRGQLGTTNTSVDVTIGTEISAMTRTVADRENERES